MSQRITYKNPVARRLPDSVFFLCILGLPILAVVAVVALAMGAFGLFGEIVAGIIVGGMILGLLARD